MKGNWRLRLFFERGRIEPISAVLEKVMSKDTSAKTFPRLKKKPLKREERKET
jgi:hypothetical protein